MVEAIDLEKVIEKLAAVRDRRKKGPSHFDAGVVVGVEYAIKLLSE